MDKLFKDFDDKYDVHQLLKDGRLKTLLSNPDFIDDLLKMIDGEGEEMKLLINELHLTAKEQDAD